MGAWLFFLSCLLLPACPGESRSKRGQAVLSTNGDTVTSVLLALALLLPHVYLLVYRASLPDELYLTGPYH
uniref:Uncharacterized protein n=1 Tax=Picea glauca TaxID=3330 RepID=A0A124GNQ1_PICGL|nr:hypothetical protein ABT39_MTgene2746 [Picea glauca]QHR92139.1 hypothetical protein Q903MT_gene6176 [Picea sitchensis]